jgi:hypothetical protein
MSTEEVFLSVGDLSPWKRQANEINSTSFSSGLSKFACLHDLLEPTEEVLDVGTRPFAKQRGNRSPDFPCGQIVFKGDAHEGAPPAGGRFEFDIPGSLDRRSFDGTPTDHFVFYIPRDFRIPLNRDLTGRGNCPSRSDVIKDLHGLQNVGDPCQVSEMPPERIKICRGSIDDYGFLEFQPGVFWALQCLKGIDSSCDSGANACEHEHLFCISIHEKPPPKSLRPSPDGAVFVVPLNCAVG